MMLTDWRKWCRLCAKYELDCGLIKWESFANLSFLVQKHFAISLPQIAEAPDSICTECQEFIAKLERFNERCAKVDKMFSQLINEKANEHLEQNYLHALRYQVGLDADEKLQCIRTLKVDKTTDTDDLITVECTVELATTNGSTDLQKRRGRPKKAAKKKKKVKVETADVNKSVDDNIADVENDIEIEVLNYDGDDVDNDPDFHVNSDQENAQIGEDYSDDNEDDEDYIDENELKDPPKRLRRKVEPDNKIYNCPLCKKDFVKKRSYDAHMRANHPKSDNPFVCSQCTKRFPSLYKQQRHETTHLPDELRLVHPCQFCDKRFSQLINVNAHIRSVHKRDRPFICEECGKSFVDKGALKEHQIIHSNEFPFQCSQCPKKCKNMARLRKHEDIHKTTAYMCPHCGLKLNTKTTLRMHMVVHSDQKKYKCQYCGNEYKRSKALKNHLILHTGLRPYTCPFCEKTFANGSNCRSHKKKAHPAELAALEASGEVVPVANIPKLEHLQPKIPSARANDDATDIIITENGNNEIVVNKSDRRPVTTRSNSSQ